MRATVTGAAGFLGRHFAAELRRRGAQVQGWDVSDGTDCRHLFAASDYRRWDLVVHCAAVEPNRVGIDGNPTHLADNLDLDVAMWRWAVRTRQHHVLYLSSCAVYPRRLQEAGGVRLLAEADTGDVDPSDDYGWTKLTGERMARAAQAAGVGVTVLRPFSGYGSDQSQNFPFRAIVERARRREDPFTVWGTGRQVRDWVHVDDVVGAALALVEAGVAGPTNVCTGLGTSMLELAEMACAEVGYRPTFAPKLDAPAGVMRRVGDPTVLHRYYVPAVSLAEGVKRALAG